MSVESAKLLVDFRLRLYFCLSDYSSLRGSSPRSRLLLKGPANQGRDELCRSSLSRSLCPEDMEEIGTVMSRERAGGGDELLLRKSFILADEDIVWN